MMPAPQNSDPNPTLTAQPTPDNPDTRPVRRFWWCEACAVLAVELLMLAGEPRDQAARIVARVINRRAVLPVKWRSIVLWRHELWSAATDGDGWPSDTVSFARKTFVER